MNAASPFERQVPWMYFFPSFLICYVVFTSAALLRNGTLERQSARSLALFLLLVKRRRLLLRRRGSWSRRGSNSSSRCCRRSWTALLLGAIESREGLGDGAVEGLALLGRDLELEGGGLAGAVARGEGAGL